MRIPDDILRCIAYIGVPIGGFERPEKMVPEGTAFFVTVPSKVSAKVSCVYLITARHVVEPLLGRNDMLIRVNQTGGGAFYGLAGDQDLRWWFHPLDKNVDVAVAGWSPPAEVDYRAVPTSMFLTDHIINSNNIGPGDEVFVAGLFVPLTGFRQEPPNCSGGPYRHDAKGAGANSRRGSGWLPCRSKVARRFQRLSYLCPRKQRWQHLLAGTESWALGCTSECD